MAVIVRFLVCVTSNPPPWHGFHLPGGADAKCLSVPRACATDRQDWGHAGGKGQTREQCRGFGRFAGESLTRKEARKGLACS